MSRAWGQGSVCWTFRAVRCACRQCVCVCARARCTVEILLKKFLKSCGQWGEKKERKVALKCNKSLSQANPRVDTKPAKRCYVTKKSKRNVSRNYHVLSVPIASISWGVILLPRTGEGDLGSPNVWGYVLSYLSTVVYHNANANINSHNPVYI